jgi:hypothetical protein
MLLKAAIILSLLMILASLASGLVFLVRDGGRTDRTVIALTWRISLSIGLFLLLILGQATGLLRPHPVSPLPTVAAGDPAMVLPPPRSHASQ